MNSKQAKALSLPEILSRLGYEPVRVTKGGKEYWYASPFRKEKDPSFHTSYLGGKWIWNDFADEGGAVIDFVMRHENYTEVRDALDFLERMFQGHFFEKPVGRAGGSLKNKQPLFSFQQHGTVYTEADEETRQLEFIEAHPIQNPIIYSYLENERRIPRELADLYLLEVTYWNRSKPKSKHKPFFAFGMKNESGGYEIRAASSAYVFKSALIGRDISFHPGREEGRGAVSVFEGMLDYLSLLCMLGIDRLKGDAIVMNALSSYGRASEFIREKGYGRIDLFLDNNTAGRKAAMRFSKEFGSIVTDRSSAFAPHIDLNDAWRAGHIPAFVPSPKNPEP